jgi:hypothetical protein
MERPHDKSSPRRSNGDEKDEKLAEAERQILNGNRSVLPPATIRGREKDREREAKIKSHV